MPRKPSFRYIDVERAISQSATNSEAAIILNVPRTRLLQYLKSNELEIVTRRTLRKKIIDNMS